MYGPNSHWQGRRGELIPKMIVRAMSGKPLVIFGDGGQTRDFVYVEDAARALILVGNKPECLGRTIQFCTGVETPILEVARLICGEFGIDPEEGIKFQASRPGDVMRQVGDNTLFQRMVGFGPMVDLREGIRRTVSWYRSLTSSPMELLSQEILRNWE
jgi:UDP-glucose 4-epimerase